MFHENEAKNLQLGPAILIQHKSLGSESEGFKACSVTTSRGPLYTACIFCTCRRVLTTSNGVTISTASSPDGGKEELKRVVTEYGRGKSGVQTYFIQRASVLVCGCVHVGPIV